MQTLLKMTLSTNTNEWVTIDSTDMDYNTKFAYTLKEMKDMKGSMDRGLETFMKALATKGR
jgi:hypothetical protein